VEPPRHILSGRILREEEWSAEDCERMAAASVQPPNKRPTLDDVLAERKGTPVEPPASAAVEELRWLNLLRGYRKMVNAVAPHFDKPITDDNVVHWMNLNNAGATIDEAIAKHDDAARAVLSLPAGGEG
jgi:hypothetical protein